MIKVLFLTLILWSVVTGGRSDSTTEGEGETTKVKEEEVTTTDVSDVEQEDSGLGGQVASIEDYPYIVSIEGNVNCTGIIVDSRFVFTTVECFNKSDPWRSNFTALRQESTVRVGSDYHDKGGEVKRLKWLYDHPFSDVFSDIYGFVIAELSEPLVENSLLTFKNAVFSDLHDPTNERTDALVNSGAICKMVGFGDSQSYQSHTGMLHETPMKLLEWTECKDADVTIEPEFEICAGLPSYHEDICVNDVSAPLVCNNKVYGVLVGHNKTCRISFDRPVRFLRTDQATGFMTLIQGCVEDSDCYMTHLPEFWEESE